MQPEGAVTRDPIGGFEHRCSRRDADAFAADRLPRSTLGRRAHAPHVAAVWTDCGHSGVLAGTAILQGIELSGGLNGLFGTAYGAVLLIKAALFAMLIALAANNRLRLTPALASRESEGTRRSLALSIGIETAVGLLVVLAAAGLSALEPGMHITSG